MMHYLRRILQAGVACWSYAKVQSGFLMQRHIGDEDILLSIFKN